MCSTGADSHLSKVFWNNIQFHRIKLVSSVSGIPVCLILKRYCTTHLIGTLLENRPNKPFVLAFCGKTSKYNLQVSF